MREIKLNKKKVLLYDSIEELPITRFHKYNKMILVDAGIGSDLAGLDRLIERVARYVKKNDLKNAEAELENMRQNVYFIQNNISPRYLAFAALVKSVDGVSCDDLSDDGLQKIVNMLSDENHKEVTEHLDSVKKKIDSELREYFPVFFESSSVKEYYDMLKRRTTLILNKITGKEKAGSDEIEKITDDLILFNVPTKFTGKDGFEVNHDKQFEKTCLLMSENLHTDPKKFTVLAYYNALEYLKELAKKQNKKIK